jgi:hypothetical protein
MLTEHEDSAGWFESRLRRLGSQRSAPETRCVSQVPEQLNSEQHLGNTNGPICEFKHAIVR